MVALIGWIAAQELPGPVGIADRAQPIVVGDFRRPLRSHIKSLTRHGPTGTSLFDGTAWGMPEVLMWLISAWHHAGFQGSNDEECRVVAKPERAVGSVGLCRRFGQPIRG